MKPTLEEIIRVVSNYYSVPLDEVLTLSRKKYIIKTKHVYHYLAYDVFAYGIVDIGRLLQQDHSTVCHGKGKIKNELKFYPEVHAEIEELKSIFRPKNKLEIQHIDLLQLTINYTKSFLSA